MTFQPDFSSLFFWFFAALILVDIVLLFIYVIKKNKAALYACLVVFFILVGIVTLTTVTSTSTTEGSTPEPVLTQATPVLPEPALTQEAPVLPEPAPTQTTPVSPEPAPAQTAPASPEPAPTQTTPEPVIPPPVTPTPSSSGESKILVATETDSSWKTYTSPSFGFNLIYPMKGKYAPTWEIKNFDLNDSHVSNGCYYKSDNTTEGGNFSLTQDQVKFCQTETEDNGAGQHYVIDDYSTTIGTRVVVIEFTKHTVNADMMDCAGKMTAQYSTSEIYCSPFVLSEYQTTLDGIVGNFKMNAVAQ